MANREILEKWRDSISNLVFHTGLDPFASGSQWKLRWNVLVFNVVYMICASLTVYKSLLEMNVVAISVGGSSVGFGCQAIVISVSLYNHRKTIRDQYAKMAKYYQGLSAQECKYVEENTKLMWFCCRIFKHVVLFTILAVILAPTFPGNNQPLPLVLEIPLTDVAKSPGYEIAYLYQIYIAVYGVRVYCGFLQLSLVFFCHHTNLVELLVNDMENNRTPIKELINHHVRIISLQKLIENIFGLYVTVQIIGTIFQISLGLYVCMYYKSVQNYILTFMSLCQLFVTCTYGYYVQRKAERLAVAIFSSYRWNELSLNDQMCVKVMLIVAQAKVQLRAGPGRYFHISFELFLKVKS